MSKPLIEHYLEWLYSQIRTDHGRRTDREYWSLLRLLLSKEFVWTVANDDNRVVDGLDLRMEFVNELGVRGTAPELAHQPNAQISGGASVLEVLIGLSRRLSFLTGYTAEGWAWQLLVNLELHRMRDPLSARKKERVDEILETLIWRTYSPDGQGGFFPLGFPEKDQREVELWYQMCTYIEENPRL